jgi:hypothetical protein
MDRANGLRRTSATLTTAALGSLLAASCLVATFPTPVRSGGDPCRLSTWPGFSREIPVPLDDWNPGTDCTLSYYNQCVGWATAFLWRAQQPAYGYMEHPLGVAFESCAPGSASTLLETSEILVDRGAAPGYGYTGSMSVFEADPEGCPTGTPLASQSWLPITGWNTHEWGSLLVPDRFAVVATPGVMDPGNRTYLVVEHPSMGPTGPTACGTCIPTARVTHSFCQVEDACVSIDDLQSACDLELFLRVALNFGPPISIESSSWGRIKGMYR